MSSTPLNDAVPMPEVYLKAAQALAARIGLDADQLAQGRFAQYKGVSFCLGHHGNLDPTGLMFMLNVGELPGEGQAAACKRMLEHNVITAAALRGFYGIMPGTDHVLYCIRFDLEKTPDTVDAIVALVDATASNLEALTAALAAEEQRMSREDAAAGAHAL